MEFTGETSCMLSLQKLPPICLFFQTELLDKLAMQIIEGKIIEGQSVKIGVEKNKIVMK